MYNGMYNNYGPNNQMMMNISPFLIAVREILNELKNDPKYIQYHIFLRNEISDHFLSNIEQLRHMFNQASGGAKQIDRSTLKQYIERLFADTLNNEQMNRSQTQNPVPYGANQVYGQMQMQQNNFSDWIHSNQPQRQMYYNQQQPQQFNGFDNTPDTRQQQQQQTAPPNMTVASAPSDVPVLPVLNLPPDTESSVISSKNIFECRYQSSIINTGDNLSHSGVSAYDILERGEYIFSSDNKNKIEMNIDFTKSLLYPELAVNNASELFDLFDNNSKNIFIKNESKKFYFFEFIYTENIGLKFNSSLSPEERAKELDSIIDKFKLILENQGVIELINIINDSKDIDRLELNHHLSRIIIKNINTLLRRFFLLTESIDNYVTMHDFDDILEFLNPETDVYKECAEVLGEDRYLKLMHAIVEESFNCLFGYDWITFSSFDYSEENILTRFITCQNIQDNIIEIDSKNSEKIIYNKYDLIRTEAHLDKIPNVEDVMLKLSNTINKWELYPIVKTAYITNIPVKNYKHLRRGVHLSETSEIHFLLNNLLDGPKIAELFVQREGIVEQVSVGRLPTGELLFL